MVILDTADSKEMVKQAKFLHKMHPLAGVIPGSEYAVITAAEIANALGLPGHDVATIRAFRNKASMREILATTNIRIPKYYIIPNEAALEEAAHTTQFPAVIKPTLMAGSLNVSKVENLEELRTAYRTMRYSGVEEMGHSPRQGIMLEEYIGGKEFSVEGYVDHTSTVYILSITEKFLTPEPNFIEIGHIVKADIDPVIAQQISDYVQAIAKELKVKLGVIHWELKVDDTGPVLIEAAVRPGGGNIITLVKLTTGVDLAEIMLLSHLGWPLEPALQYTALYKVAGVRFFMIDHPHNCYTQLTGEDKLQALASYVEYHVTVLPHQKIAHPETFEGEIASVIFAGHTYHEVLTAMQTAQSLIKITYPRLDETHDHDASASRSRFGI
jgi:biotin carboxylase